MRCQNPRRVHALFCVAIVCSQSEVSLIKKLVSFLTTISLVLLRESLWNVYETTAFQIFHSHVDSVTFAAKLNLAFVNKLVKWMESVKK